MENQDKESNILEIILNIAILGSCIFTLAPIVFLLFDYFTANNHEETALNCIIKRIH